MSRVSPAVRSKLQRLSYLVAGLVLLVGAYNGYSTRPRSPIWLTAANVLFGLVNLGAAPFAEKVGYKVEAAFYFATALLIYGTAYTTFLTGARHWPLASAWTFAGTLYLAVAALHYARKGRKLSSRPVEP